MKLGLMGTGNMGTAIVKGYLAAGADPKNIFVFNRTRSKAEAFASETGVISCGSTEEVLSACDMIMLAVKPNMIQTLSEQLNEEWKKVGTSRVLTIISIAAGVGLETLEQYFDFPVKAVRVMPNTPSLVGEGMSILCKNSIMTEEEFQQVKDIFNSIGRTAVAPESQFDAVTGLSGSGPAFVYVFIEALADAGVLKGLSRELAYQLAAQTVLGAAKMVLETGVHPGELKDRVCSPGGTTIEGVRALEKNGFRNAAMEAVQKSAEKSAEMTKLNSSKG